MGGINNQYLEENKVPLVAVLSAADIWQSWQSLKGQHGINI